LVFDEVTLFSVKPFDAIPNDYINEFRFDAFDAVSDSGDGKFYLSISSVNREGDGREVEIEILCKAFYVDRVFSPKDIEYDPY
jgi:hypothetical protein